jgi:hypothetical protein
VNLPLPYLVASFVPECAVGFAGLLTKHLCDLLKNMGDHRGVVRQNGAPKGLNEKRGVVVSKVRRNYPCWKYVDIPRLNPLESRWNAARVRFST